MPGDKITATEEAQRRETLRRGHALARESAKDRGYRLDPRIEAHKHESLFMRESWYADGYSVFIRTSKTVRNRVYWSSSWNDAYRHALYQATLNHGLVELVDENKNR